MQIESFPDKPKFFAQKCPVCNGFGTLKWGKITCHGCLGKGYILLPVDRENENNKKLHHNT